MSVYKLTSMVPSDRHDEAALVMGKLIEDWAKTEGVVIAAVEVIEGEIAGGNAPTPPGWTMLVAQAIGEELATADDDTSMDVVVEDVGQGGLTCFYCGAAPGQPHRTLVFHPSDMRHRPDRSQR